ncbi:UDP-N-acetylmuramoylalanyl-D-glutamate--2,6-diaminopimelate ligase, partial [hydrothermal vent metagenome]
MKLKKLLNGIFDSSLDEDIQDFEVNGVYCDSRKVQSDGIFLAMQGENSKGSDYLEDVFNKGVKVVFVEKQDYDLFIEEDRYLLVVDDIQKFSRQIIQKFYQNPSQKTRVIGITGTNGKTTVSYLIESILHEAEKSCSVIGTVNYRIGERILPAQNTTPGFFENQRLLADIVNDGVEYCVMEVSSHALVQQRVDLIDFRSAVFTNLTSDHLDYHKTRDNYFSAKAKMFVDLPTESISVINVDDECGRKLFSKTSSEIFTYGIEKNADVMANDIQLDISGTSFKIISPQGDLMIQTFLIGQYNIYNILAAV